MEVNFHTKMPYNRARYLLVSELRCKDLLALLSWHHSCFLISHDPCFHHHFQFPFRFETIRSLDLNSSLLRCQCLCTLRKQPRFYFILLGHERLTEKIFVIFLLSEMFCNWRHQHLPPVQPHL